MGYRLLYNSNISTKIQYVLLKNEEKLMIHYANEFIYYGDN